MKRLTDHFDRVTVISLASRKDRRERLQRHLQQLELADGIEWTEAVPGTLTSMPRGWSAGPGAWGCLQSHVRALRQAQSDGVESVLILEDDVVFSPHTSSCLPLLMAALPDDWGQFYLGGQHLAPPARTQSPLIWRARNINRTHAWACRGKYLPDVIGHLTRPQNYTQRPPGSPGWHIDHQLGRAHEQGLWPCYTASWWLAGQEADTSDICCQAVERRWWHPRRYAIFLPFVHLTQSPASGDELHFLTSAEDGKFENVLPHNARLLAWMHTQAQLALDRGCLPAWRSPRLCPERVAGLWPAGIRQDSTSGIHDYPFNGLFRHDLATALKAAA